ncbi:helicase [Aureococcus anophagefferens]|nr:helicase [Aureococcus anophagefferens]
MDTVRALKIKELKALIERAGLEHADCLDKDALVERAATAVARLGACKQAQDAASGALVLLRRPFRAGPSRRAVGRGAAAEQRVDRLLGDCGVARGETVEDDVRALARDCGVNFVSVPETLPSSSGRSSAARRARGALDGSLVLADTGAGDDDDFEVGETLSEAERARRAREAAEKAAPSATSTEVQGAYDAALDGASLASPLFPRAAALLPDLFAQPAAKAEAPRRVACSSTTVIIDEAHFLRNATSKWGIGAALLGHSSKFCVSATGTPYNNGPQDMAALVSFFDARQDAATKAWWVDACATHESPATAAVQKAVATWRPRGLLRRDKPPSRAAAPRVVRSLPVCHQSLVEAADDADRAGLLQMGSAARVGARAEAVGSGGRATDAIDLDDGEEAKDADDDELAASAPAAYAKMGDGPLYCAEVHGGFRASAKLVAAVAAVRKAVARGEAVVFWTFYKGVSDLAEAMLDAHGVSSLRFDGDVRADERGAVLDDFRAGGADVLLATVHSGGTGLNITRGDGHQAVAAAFYDAALTIDDCMRHVNDIKLDNATGVIGAKMRELADALAVAHGGAPPPRRRPSGATPKKTKRRAAKVEEPSDDDDDGPAPHRGGQRPANDGGCVVA